MVRTQLNRQTVIQAAHAIVAEEGLGKLTMRALSRRLDIEAASLYTHVRDKEDLLDGLAELVLSKVIVPDTDDLWPERVRLHCAALRGALQANPDLVPIVAVRPFMSPVTRDLAESAILEMAAIGLDQDQAVLTLQTIVAVTTGHALGELRRHPALRSDNPAAVAAAREGLPAEHYPQLTAALDAGVGDADESFDHTVQMIIDGIAALLGANTRSR